MKKVKMTMTHKKDNKRFVSWWIKKNWLYLIVLFLDLVFISAMIGGVILWLME